MPDHNEAMRLIDLFELEPDPESLYRQAAALLRQQAERELALMAERDQHQATATALIALLADIRKACGDNGKRMQPELVEFIGAMSTERDQLRAEVKRLRAIGSQLANVAFNWSQEANGTGQRLSAEDRSLLKSLQTQWDAARTTHKETE